MRRLTLIAALAAAAALSGCNSTRDDLPELGSVSSGFQRSNDTYGTNRRMDVYGGATAPSLPTMGATGYGK